MKQKLLTTFPMVVIACLLLPAPAAQAQTFHLSRSQQKKEVRNSIREAKQITSDFDESHLNVQAYNFQNGETGRKQKKTKKKDEMPINADGTAVVKTKWLPKKSAQARARKK